jgi:phosphatidylserine/phosphatidylglycerophosphate/cardiolipin synthase-like enzyme
VALVTVTVTACHLPDLSTASADPNAPGNPAAPAAGTAAGLVTEPDQGYQPIYQFITSAQKSVDMTMYELTDTTAEQDLAADAHRGVQVRVILDRNLEQSHNQPAFTFLSQQGVHVVWANPQYAATHQKTITVDGANSAILTGNLTSQYYSTSRDFAVMDSTPADVTAIEQTFTADFAGTSVTPPGGADLVWSPTTAQPSLLGLINEAKTSLQVENEEMANSAIVSALTAAAQRGVTVQVIMTRATEWKTDFNQLTQAGVHVATYANSSSALYIHAKVVIADNAVAFVGSENFSTASLTRNRELGTTIGTAAIVAALHTTLAHDYAAAQPWSTA